MVVYSIFVERLALVRLAVIELRRVFGVFRAVFTIYRQFENQAAGTRAKFPLRRELMNN